MKIEEVLKERGETYGQFKNYAKICNDLKGIKWEWDSSNLVDIHHESLDMIFSKIARILNGDPNHVDSWRDIAGYAELVVRELENVNKNV